MSDSYSVSFGDITLEVTPERMYETATNIDVRIKQTYSLLEEMRKLFNETEGFWEGNRAEQERKYFSNELKNFEAIMSTFNSYVQELRVITSNYEKTEGVVSAEASALPSNIIS